MKELIIQLEELNFKYCQSEDLYERYYCDGSYHGIKITKDGLEVSETPMYGGNHRFYKIAHSIEEAIEIIETELI